MLDAGGDEKKAASAYYTSFAATPLQRGRSHAHAATRARPMVFSRPKLKPAAAQAPKAGKSPGKPASLAPRSRHCDFYRAGMPPRRHEAAVGQPGA